MRPRALTLALALAAAGSAARADAVPPMARQLSDRGRALHDVGDYQQAIVAYQRAYALAPSPGLLFNMAQAYRLAGDCGAAASMYRRYLSAGIDPEARRVAERHLAVVESCARRATGTATALPLPAAAITSDDEPEPGLVKRRAGVAIAGGGALLLIAGAYFAADAASASDQVSAAEHKGGDGKQVAALDDRGQRSSELATGFVIAGGAAVATGAVLYLLGRHDQHEHPALTVAPIPRGAGVEMAWRF